MDRTRFSAAQMNLLRQTFKRLNYFMVWMWKVGLGRAINIWPAGFGRIMVIKHTGRKSGRVRLTPVNYALVAGEIYSVAGFGGASDWYRNLMNRSEVELWLPGEKVPARAEDISDCPERLRLLRAVIVASGFAGPLFGVSSGLPDEKLAALSRDYCLIHFRQEK